MAEKMLMPGTYKFHVAIPITSPTAEETLVKQASRAAVRVTQCIVDYADGYDESTVETSMLKFQRDGSYATDATMRAEYVKGTSEVCTD